MRIKSVLIKNTILVICHRKKLFQAWTDALSLSELVLFHSLKWQLSITTKYKCFILERALVERLKAILRKLLSLFERGVWVRASCFALGRLHVYKDVRSFQCTYYAQSRPQSSWGQHKKCRLLQSRVSSMYRGAHFSALGLARARDHVADQKKKRKTGYGSEAGANEKKCSVRFLLALLTFFLLSIELSNLPFQSLATFKDVWLRERCPDCQKSLHWRNGNFKSFWFLSSNQISVLHRVYS